MAKLLIGEKPNWKDLLKNIQNTGNQPNSHNLKKKKKFFSVQILFKQHPA